MEPWAWLTAYLVGFALLQLVLYRYLSGKDSTSELSRPSGDHRARADAGGETHTEPMTEASIDNNPERGAESDEEGIHCKHCGTLNERHATITYCRHCTQPLQ
jgi:hypothetical protein